MKKINRIIPRAMKPIGEKLALDHCNGLGLSEGSEEFEEEFKSYVYNFNDEAYGLSMTPSGLIHDGHVGSNPLMKSNPATPKVQAHYFEIMENMFGKSGYVAKHIKNADHQLRYERQIRGSIASITHFLLESLYNSKIKSNASHSSDFEFKKDGGPANDETVLSQYLRLFYTVEITKALESVFLAPKIDIGNIIDNVLGTGWEKNPYRALNPKEVREEFVRAVYEGVKKPSGGFVESDESNSPSEEESNNEAPVKQNPSHVSSNFFSHDSGFFFNKVKIDNFIENNINNCAQVVPKKSYIKKSVASKFEIEKANMQEPIVFGTIIENGKPKNFLLKGEPQILKANSNGLPTIDCLMLSSYETFKLISPTSQTMKKITSFKNEIIKHGDLLSLSHKDHLLTLESERELKVKPKSDKKKNR